MHLAWSASRLPPKALLPTTQLSFIYSGLSLVHWTCQALSHLKNCFPRILYLLFFFHIGNVHQSFLKEAVPDFQGKLGYLFLSFRALITISNDKWVPFSSISLLPCCLRESRPLFYSLFCIYLAPSWPSKIMCWMNNWFSMGQSPRDYANADEGEVAGRQNYYYQVIKMAASAVKGREWCPENLCFCWAGWICLIQLTPFFHKILIRLWYQISKTINITVPIQ